MARWSWPSTADYLRVMPALTRAFGGAAFAHRSAFCTDHYEGVALWLPPGVSPDEEAMVALVEESLDLKRKQEMFAVFEQMAQFHPTEPHWYLPLIGVDPVHQGKGVGSALLKHVTERFDRDGAVAYLESSNPRNIPLYERHGFKQVGQIQAGSSPVMVAMVRR
jgi:ribosomal protein S18 acetylase RimI-like enzyme